ncbi:hypothetical protein LCGC14_3035760 [marine sediment metagenome]|uniref:Uncharacterized protein n=1 Tax=marine sediment metagenome TaxID=412755 RepID=A0A0F8XEB7_9ZZZZ
MTVGHLFFLTHSLFSRTISKEELFFLTSEWKGERFDDSHPKLPDEILERAKKIGIDDTWTALEIQGTEIPFRRRPTAASRPKFYNGTFVKGEGYFSFHLLYRSCQ